MIERVTKENLDQYEAFIKKHPKGLFQHSSKWAKVKSAWKWEAVMLRDEDGNIKGSADVLIRTVPVIKASLLYCCRGFVADEDDFATFDSLPHFWILQRNTTATVLKSTRRSPWRTRPTSSIC